MRLNWDRISAWCNIVVVVTAFAVTAAFSLTRNLGPAQLIDQEGEAVSLMRGSDNRLASLHHSTQLPTREEITAARHRQLQLRRRLAAQGRWPRHP